MTRYELNYEYYVWMCRLVCDGHDPEDSFYDVLLQHLHGIDFNYSLPMDGNRAADGVDLRYRFGYENHYDDVLISSYLDNRPCSVLEMMVALALHCEEHIMDDPNKGNRIDQWFWEMIQSLGLISMRDSDYDANYTNDVIQRFLDHEYRPDGEGGLFTIRNATEDLRNVEIWYQMNWYLNSIL